MNIFCKWGFGNIKKYKKSSCNSVIREKQWKTQTRGQASFMETLNYTRIKQQNLRILKQQADQKVPRQRERGKKEEKYGESVDMLGNKKHVPTKD